MPGTTIVVEGNGFVPDSVATSQLTLNGTFNDKPIDVSLPATYVSATELAVLWKGGIESSMGEKQGIFDGTAQIVLAQDDGQTLTSPKVPTKLQIAPSLTPSVASIAQGLIFINDRVEINGDGFLLGGTEGTTTVGITGCFQPEKSTKCDAIKPLELGTKPTRKSDRTNITFAFSPKIAGIRPGLFKGTISVQNKPGLYSDGAPTQAAPVDVEFELTSTTVTGITPNSASLGQYINFEGGGFVDSTHDDGDAEQMFTTITLEGVFKASNSASENTVNVELVPEFVSGNRVRYVVSEDDAFGLISRPRKQSGKFTGTAKPTVQYKSDVVHGTPMTASFEISSIKQVVWLNFEASYVGSLRHFGLRAADGLIRDRVFAVAIRDYEGVNIEFRANEPQDFALYSRVDISGQDPNGVGMLGYDNSPGKDVNNMRLYDQIGGVNAQTQQDGAPGYGGVFVESLFAFSMHPGTFAKSVAGASPFFDAIFDPFRPDLGGAPVIVSDFQHLTIPVLTSGEPCPVKDTNDRGLQIACAVWTLGSMIGTTMTHEIGHSLGLADAYGNGFHNVGDLPDRLMDSGAHRPFLERAELLGYGPAVFCEQDFDYLAKILPVPAPPPKRIRPRCW